MVTVPTSVRGESEGSAHVLGAFLTDIEALTPNRRLQVSDLPRSATSSWVAKLGRWPKVSASVGRQ